MKVRGTASALILRTIPVQDQSSDTGRRLLKGEIAFSLGQTWDQKWQYVSAPQGHGWASALYLEPALTEPATPKPKYSTEGEDPELTQKIEALRVLAAAEGIEFTTADFGGVRTKAQTDLIMKYRDNDYEVYIRRLSVTHPGKKPIPKEKWRLIAPFGRSYHNYGCARDLKPTKWPQSFTESKALGRLRQLAPKAGLKTIDNDPPHVQLPISLAAARKRWESRQ